MRVSCAAECSQQHKQQCAHRSLGCVLLHRGDTSSPSLRSSWVGGCWLVGEIRLVGGSVTPEPLRRGGWVGPGDSPQIRGSVARNSDYAGCAPRAAPRGSRARIVPRGRRAHRAARGRIDRRSVQNLRSGRVSDSNLPYFPIRILRIPRILMSSAGSVLEFTAFLMRCSQPTARLQ